MDCKKKPLPVKAEIELERYLNMWGCVHKLTGHQSLTSGMELRDNLLVSGNADSTVRVWDVRTGQCLHTLQGPNRHQSAVTCLQFCRGLVLSSSDDGTVKLWDLRTGAWVRDLVSLQSQGSGGVVWRIRASDTRLVCAAGSRNGTEETKLLLLDFEPEGTGGDE
ncbi:F-box/WD repeat-containing protein 7-like [Gadus chalcogrammus]|uniref:F-box/WD repeat-containing protein 7-like n=1 Tax=Gadus chalcogrammus TaxID=1042646 RepID=UPI0024C4C0AE|nr:F-box/WD repeat-containing protein 7-like [Gadus chalcogrammus]